MFVRLFLSNNAAQLARRVKMPMLTDRTALVYLLEEPYATIKISFFTTLLVCGLLVYLSMPQSGGAGDGCWWKSGFNYQHRLDRMCGWVPGLVAGLY